MLNKSCLQLEDIYDFFQNPPPLHLNQELAVCYVLSVLRHKDSYGTELIQELEQEYITYRLSDTILYRALQCLETEGFIHRYRQKVEGPGRPRFMYRLAPHARSQAEEATQLWQTYVSRHVSFEPDLAR